MHHQAKLPNETQATATAPGSDDGLGLIIYPIACGLCCGGAIFCPPVVPPAATHMDLASPISSLQSLQSVLGPPAFKIAAGER